MEKKAKKQQPWYWERARCLPVFVGKKTIKSLKIHKFWYHKVYYKYKFAWQTSL